MPPELDAETKARIEAEEAYRAQVRRALPTPPTQHPSLWRGIAGNALLGLSPFLPMMTVPILGPINLIGAGNRDGILLVGLALLGFILTFAARAWLLFSGLCAAALSVLIFLNMRGASGVSPLMEMSWGWVVLIAGLVLIFWSALSTPARPVSAAEDARDTLIMRILIGVILLLVAVFLFL
ncbi:hypothetical protein [Deinococcus daejeonensis]|uniref:Uncharacterized protein n=1 Tax=Deinococcus daejeonensis TaxID=1007098 RepID=A0ABQ2JCA1_9DEIO|nr:hypothetical protein [Deinococcus daejeonensis]GGN44109.1 hypothetical protein GCM10010842_32270 [Deinococcus daejeonensis]